MQRSIKRQTIKNISYVTIVQFAAVGLGIARSLLLPLFYEEVSSFGYWQVYLLYSSYVAICTIGFNDGFYLKYGAYNYDGLPHGKIRSSIRIQVAVLAVFTVIFAGIASGESNLDRRFALFCAATNIIILGINGIMVFVFQVTNNIKKYCFFSIADKLVLFVAILVIMLINEQNYKILIILDLGIKTCVVLIMMACTKELWLGRQLEMSTTLIEYTENITSGIILLMANLMGMLMSGIGKLIIENLGNIEEYAYYSFAASVTYLALTFISAVSSAIYPVLKRLPETTYGTQYQKISEIMKSFIVIIPLFYFPAQWIIQEYIPKYVSVLGYVNLLFGVVVIQCKINLLNNTFYSALRKEKIMLKANIECVLIFVIIALLSYIYTKALWTIALSTLIAMMLRCYTSEIFLRNLMDCKIYRGIIIEIVCISIFVISTSYCTVDFAALIYGIVVIIFFITNYSQIRDIGALIGRR